MSKGVRGGTLKSVNFGGESGGGAFLAPNTQKNTPPEVHPMLTDAAIKGIDELSAKKEKEIMEV